jgi:hypothetical protein
MWGYSIGISDIRVTLADGSERDCLQKIHPVAQSIALGFAGSVAIGFRMVSTMRYWLQCDEPDHDPDNPLGKPGNVRRNVAFVLKSPGDEPVKAVQMS